MKIKQILLTIAAYLGFIIIGLVLCAAFKRDKQTEDYIDDDW